MYKSADKAGYVKDGKLMEHDVWSVQKWLGYLFEEEVIALQKFTQESPEDAIIVNIGAGGGTSGLAFAENIGKKRRLYTVDIQDESSPFGCLEGERAVFKSAGLDHLWNKQWYQIHGDSIDVGKAWKDLAPPDNNLIDFLFIDGNHSYEGCTGDIKTWLPSVRHGGFIAVHDYKKGRLSFEPDGRVRPHPKTWLTVDQAVDDLLTPNLYMVCLVQSMVVFEVDEHSAERVLGEG